ncbi:MAG TPA: hypothetical protein VF062_05035, partial [Candidatus Limnocylindrales bacterium]
MFRITRRGLMLGAAATAVTPSVFVASSPASADDSVAGRGRLIPPGKLGTITFTQRDVPSRIGI